MYGLLKPHWTPPGKAVEKEIEKCDTEDIKFMSNFMFLSSHCLHREKKERKSRVLPSVQQRRQSHDHLHRMNRNVFKENS